MGRLGVAVDFEAAVVDPEAVEVLPLVLAEALLDGLLDSDTDRNRPRPRQHREWAEALEVEGVPIVEYLQILYWGAEEVEEEQHEEQ